MAVTALLLRTAPLRQWFHAEDADALFDELGHDVVGEAAEVGVHDVERHLDGVEMEVVLARRLRACAGEPAGPCGR